jgi:hypothetical protein
MSENTLQTEPRADVIASLRALAGQGASVRKLADEVISRVGLKGDEVLPLLWYFSKAFALPLPVVLPLREWLGTDRDEEIDALLLPAIRASRDRWEALSAGEQDGRAWGASSEAGLVAPENRS